MATIRHTFQSGLPDGPDATLLQPSNWNADHDVIELTMDDIIYSDPAYPTQTFHMAIAIRNEGTAEEYIETLWTEI